MPPRRNGSSSTSSSSSSSSSTTTGATIRMQLVRSPIGNPARQRATVQALGLRRLRQIVTHTDSPAMRGMVARVPHLVRILED